MRKRLCKFLLSTVGATLPLSYHPFGEVARRFRYYCAKNIVEHIGIRVNIEKGARVNEGVIIGDHGSVGVNCLVSSGTTIGRHTMMGPDCLVYTSNHKFDKEKLKYDGETKRKDVIIGENVWIGARCIILPGITIGNGSTIGAGSVVTKNVPAYSLAAGNPARVIKSLIS